MATFAELLPDIRERLDEPTATLWSDEQLRRWVNEGLRDASRYTKHLRDRKTFPVTIGVSEYTVAPDVIEIENLYWVPDDGSNRSIPLTGYSFDGADQIWGAWQNTYDGHPALYAPHGFPPNLQLKLYPAPDYDGTISMLIIRMPTEIAINGNDDNNTLDWPPAWTDLLIDYMEMAALRKDRDPRWREAFELYTSKRDKLLTDADYSDLPEQIIMDGYAGHLPRWLVDPTFPY